MKEDLGQPIVWIINHQHWPRALLRAELIERGFDAIGFEDAGQALAALGDKRTPRPRLIVLELYELALRQIELDNLLHRKIPVIAMKGSTSSDGQWLDQYQWAAVMIRPFTIGAICDAVEELLRRSAN